MKRYQNLKFEMFWIYISEDAKSIEYHIEKKVIYIRI